MRCSRLAGVYTDPHDVFPRGVKGVSGYGVGRADRAELTYLSTSFTNTSIGSVSCPLS